jgi:hypothetical protein
VSAQSQKRLPNVTLMKNIEALMGFATTSKTQRGELILNHMKGL